MRVSRSGNCLTFLFGFLFLLCSGPAHAGNVYWTMGDSLVTACPGGDSVVAGHPAILRVAVNYADASGNARVGVPPESIWVTLKGTGVGTIVLHDATDSDDDFVWKVYADDSTRSTGLTRFSLFGFSGCGDLNVRLYVSGVSQGTRTARVRSLDADAHDPVDVVADSAFACDWDYSGAVNSSDIALLYPHADHGHRNALHGTLVRRTTECFECYVHLLGVGTLSWNPASTKLALSAFAGPSWDCKVFIVPANPADGNALTQLSHPPPTYHDYAPDWSPLGHEVAFDRRDSVIYRKGIPGLASDTTLHLITHSSSAIWHRGDISPAISPDGKWVAFSHTDLATGDWNLYKIPIEGMEAGKSATQLTSTRYANDWYPRWSPDGEQIYFQRIHGINGPPRIYRINADGSGLDSVMTPTGGIAATPEVSPDGALLAMAGGTAARVTTRTMTTGLSRQLAFDKSVENYASHGIDSEYNFPILSPRPSPDGTRLALRAEPPGGGDNELWAARRNMNLPPTIEAVGGEAVDDDTPVVELWAYRGQSNDFVVEASDPEGDALDYRAHFLREDLGMSFNSYNQTLSWNPPDSVSMAEPFYVRLQVETASGGTDYAIAEIWIATGRGGGCPTLTTYTGRGWRTENTLLGRSKDGRYLVDAYKLRERPARVRDRYLLEIRETEQERTTLDQVRLLAVDHDPKLAAYASEDAVWLGERRPAHRVWGAGGEDLTHLLASGGLFGGSPGDILLVEMDDPEEQGSGIHQPGPGLFEEPCCEKDGPNPGSLKPEGAVTAAAVDAAILDASGFSIHGADQGGGWNPLATLYPREQGNETLVEGAGHGRVKIAFKGRQHLSFIGTLEGATRATPLELPLELARHSVHKNVAEALATRGGKVATLEPGQTLSLEFAAPPVPAGLVRDLFLVSRGLYTAFVPGSSGGTRLPVRFALAQSQPNPASGPALIRFELPVKAKVKLEVFDLLGRRVRVLADREFEAGYQSVEWDGRDRSGQAVRAGVYLYRMTAPGFRDRKKMIVLAH